MLRREPCPTCGRLPGLPARTERPGPWATAYVALRLTLEQELEPEVVEALLWHAARLHAQLRPSRRLGASAPASTTAGPGPGPGLGSNPGPSAARPPLPLRPATPPPTPPDPDVETYVWRL